jgi:hypothetical protein
MPSMLVKDGSTADKYIEYAQGDGSVGNPFSNLASLVEVAVSFTRPADTTAYAVSDSVNSSTSSPTVLTFSGVARNNGGSGYVTGGFCQTSQTSMTGQLRLHLFRVTVTPINDNAAYTLLNSGNSTRIGYIDFTSFTTGGTGSDTAIAFAAFPGGSTLPYICASGDTALYGVTEARNIWTPANAQTFRYQLLFDRY